MTTFTKQRIPKVNARAMSSSTKSGGGFFQRVQSFIVGAGVTALGTQYFIFKEIHEGNNLMRQKQQALEIKITALEKR